MIAKIYQSKGLNRAMVLNITGLTKHQLYYVPTGNKPGKGLTHTSKYLCDKTSEILVLPNKKIIDRIIKIKQEPDLPNWYKLICVKLKLEGWYINHKKVYRLQKEHGLLGKPRKNKGRNFVKFRRVCPSDPLRILEMDIKYVWIYELRRYCFVLTVIDTFTRFVLGWKIGYSMKQSSVKALWEEIILEYLQPAGLLSEEIHIELRNDNGKQFAGTMIQSFFKDNYLNQVFTHPYTPEENGHIESFHKTLGASLKGQQFRNIEELEIRLKQFYKTYNNERPHGSIVGLSPSKFWSLWEMEKITREVLDKKRVRFKLNIELQKVKFIKGIHKYNLK